MYLNNKELVTIQYLVRNIFTFPIIFKDRLEARVSFNDNFVRFMKEMVDKTCFIINFMVLLLLTLRSSYFLYYLNAMYNDNFSVVDLQAPKFKDFLTNNFDL